jgi:hypothetical protein
MKHNRSTLDYLLRLQRYCHLVVPASFPPPLKQDGAVLMNYLDSLRLMNNFWQFDYSAITNTHIFLTIFAGLPITTTPAGTSFVITEPAPTIAFSPIVMPGKIVAFAPIVAPNLMTVCNSCYGAFVRGNKSLLNVALGPIKTLSSIRTPSQSCTLLLSVTLSPITTSFSISTCAQILQFSPILAPANTTQNCQTRVPSPIFLLCTSASE